ncbi:MAG: hypothetical protein V7607_1704 [Solirubrobacteraceae bacterium]
MSSATGCETATDSGKLRDAGSGLRRRSRRRRAAVVAVALIACIATVALVAADPFSGHDSSPSGVIDNAAPTALASVTRRSLSSKTQLNGTLRFAGSYSVVNAAAGAATALPRVGSVVRRGHVLYRLAGRPVVLLYGQTPAYRALRKGMSGRDVRQLNANLVALGYATSSTLDPTSADFSSQTRRALERLQGALGVKDTGKLDLGRAVFLAGPARITKVMATLGTLVQPGAVIAQATSTRREVLVDLDASQQASVKVGDRVVITLPNEHTTPGVVTAVGKVASSSGDSSTGATVAVHIKPRKPSGIGSLDRATVRVAITTAKVKRALVVPVTALLALAGGGYAVETVDAQGARHLVAVKLGLFDDADGLLQVSGALSPGQRIVVPAT